MCNGELIKTLFKIKKSSETNLWDDLEHTGSTTAEETEHGDLDLLKLKDAVRLRYKMQIFALKEHEIIYKRIQLMQQIEKK